MFDQRELEFLLGCVDMRPVTTTQLARAKAIMLMRLADAVDKSAGMQVPLVQPENSPPAEPPVE